MVKNDRQYFLRTQPPACCLGGRIADHRAGGDFLVRRTAPWVRWLGVSALGLVIVQGILGGLRVVLLEQTLAIVHAAVAQAFFALTVSLAIFTSEKWRDERENPPLTDGRRLCRLCAITTAFIYLQAIFGAVLRHTGQRVDAHLFFAALVTLHVALIFIRVIKHYARSPQCCAQHGIGSFLVGQLMLGVASYLAKFTGQFPFEQGTVVLLTTTHLVVGSLMLMTSLLLTLRCFRFSSLSTRRVEARVLREQFSL